MAAPSAMAAPEHSAALSVTPPVGNASEGCSRDVCIYLNTPGDPHPGESAAKGWLYTTTYFGRFHLTGPGGLSKYSAYQAWYGGGPAGSVWTPAAFPATVGQYCMTFYQTSQSPPYTVITSQGTACENIN